MKTLPPWGEGAGEGGTPQVLPAVSVMVPVFMSMVPAFVSPHAASFALTELIPFALPPSVTRPVISVHNAVLFNDTHRFESAESPHETQHEGRADPFNSDMPPGVSFMPCIMRK